ncbi:MAG: CRISPR-associated endoribonuclease Cas6 [Leptolyngbyaceae cyanobacterium RM1_1_2]|nr:CRISPR-associated endoribonuclease Cas6 [Leptolyngbyaceae cyanobacterium RM1_1_2]
MPRAKSTPLDLTAKTLWPQKTELVGLVFNLQAIADSALYPQYTIGLHAWFLQQIQQFDAELSAYLHDGESEKPFNLSGLSGQFISHSRELQLQKGKSYQWHLNALSAPTVAGLERWLRRLPDEVALKNAPLQIKNVQIAHAPITYAQLSQQGQAQSGSVSLSFLSPTSFRRKSHHLPLPWHPNVFHSYLRRWNHFSGQPVDQDAFLDWIDNHVIIQRHYLESQKVAAGKRGSLTGFVGAIAYSLARQAAAQPDFQALFYTLTQLAPYCSTGHKTTFGLGQTRLGWQSAVSLPEAASVETLLAERIAELTETFTAQRKRQGGDRAHNIAETWATVLARRELGDSLQAIAEDLEMPYETVKTYSKLARRSLRAAND